jgi:short-subunit dehydrogenase
MMSQEATKAGVNVTAILPGLTETACGGLVLTLTA